jgi:hypothetical protein
MPIVICKDWNLNGGCLRTVYNDKMFNTWSITLCIMSICLVPKGGSEPSVQKEALNTPVLGILLEMGLNAFGQSLYWDTQSFMLVFCNVPLPKTLLIK